MTLRDYLMRLDVYRTAVPAIDPLPIKLFSLHDDHPLQQSSSQIKAVAIRHLNEQGVSYESIVLFGSTNKNILRIASNMEITRSWGFTAREIHRDLRLAGFEDICIEILNYEKAYRLHQFPIPDGSEGDAVVRRWRRARGDVMRAITDRLAHWNTVCVFFCGRALNLSLPTVVVTADPTATADWSNLTIKIQTALIQNNVTGFEVEFSVGKIMPSKTIDILPQLGNGDSIGIVGDEKFSGSLGGFVQLKTGTPPQTRMCAITCHHVSRPENRDSSDFAAVLKLQPRNTTNPRATKMRSPSQRDFDDTLTSETAILQRTLEAISKIETEQEKQDGFLPPYQDRALKRAQAKRDEVQSRVELLMSRKAPLGLTIACSGFRVNENNHKMDWALVEVSSERFMANFAPDTYAFSSAPEHRPKNKTYDSDTMPITKTAAVQPGEWVVTRGRTSGVTTGVVHKMAMEVNDWRTRNLVSTEIVVMHTSRETQVFPPVFSEEGDSGAWIFNADGIVVGEQIAHRERTEGYNDLTVMTPIIDVFEDIEALTHGKVILPVE